MKVFDSLDGAIVGMVWIATGVAIAGLGQGEALAAEQAVPPSVHFALDWCPSEAQLAELRRHLNLVMSGCCIFRGDAINPSGVDEGVLAPYARHIRPTPNLTASCGGQSPEMIAASQAAARERERNAPGRLRAMTPAAFCVAYGSATRGEEVSEIGVLPSGMRLFRAEANRRGLSVNETLARQQKIRIGTTRCQVYASWGLPEDENRTLTQAGERIQHVFDQAYVYSENGKVVAIQD